MELNAIRVNRFMSKTVAKILKWSRILNWIVIY